MKLIENGSIANHVLFDELDDQIVPLVEYLANPLLTNKVKISNDDNLAEHEKHLSSISLIVIEFNAFADGRGFSLAYRLRESLGYKNTLWASGHIIPDQYTMTAQCGIDGILIDENRLIRQPIEQWQEALNNSPILYQYPKKLTISSLKLQYKNLDTQQLMAKVLSRADLGKIALVSSFGTESAVLLHLLAKNSPNTDVLFVDTGKLFPETLHH